MKNTYFFLLSCLLLTACNVPVTTPPAELPPTSTATSIPVETVTSTPIPDVTQTPTLPDFSPVIYGQNSGSGSLLLLGGVQGGTWLEPDAASAQIRNESEYDLYSSDVRLQMTGDISAPNPICGVYFIDSDENISVSGMIGVAHGWTVTQRDVEVLSSENEFYRQVVMDWLIEQGISNPFVDNIHVSRVDIEGDGVDEVFISASHFKEVTGHETEAGDYSIVLMRKVMGSDAVTLDIISDVYHSQEPELTFPFTYSIANFMDLNQDGILEVIIEINRWEGFGAAVYQIDELDKVQVLHAFCGS